MARIDISKDMIKLGIVKFRKWHKRKFAALDEMTSDERFVHLGGVLPKPKKKDEGGN